MRFFLSSVLFFAGLSFGTMQIPDVFYFKSPMGVDQNRIMFIRYSPLQSYLEGTFCKNPFRMEHTANYRGYQAFWSVDGAKLILDSIIVSRSYFDGKTGEDYYKESKVDLKWLFGPSAEPPIAATWVNGVFHAEIKNALEKKERELSSLVEFRNGFMMPEIGRNKYVNGDYVKDASYEKLEKMKEQPSLGFVSPKCVDGWEEQLPELDLLYEEISAPKLKTALQEKRVKMDSLFALTEKAVKKDPAFQRFSEKFETIQVRNVYGMDVGCFLKVKNPEALSHVKWNIHFVKKGKSAKVNLSHTLKNYEAAEKALQKFVWLKAWREQSASHAVQMDLCGQSVCPLSFNVMIAKGSEKLWKDLHLKGIPEFVITLRENQNEIATLIGNKALDQLLMVKLNARKSDLLSLPADLEISAPYAWKSKEQTDYILISTTGETQVNKTKVVESHVPNFGALGITQ